MKRVPDAQASSLLATSSSSRIRTSLEPSITSATCPGSSLEGTIITYIENFLCLASFSQLPSTFHQPQPTVIQPIWATTRSRRLMNRKVRYCSSQYILYSVANKTAHGVPDSSLEERIEELNSKIKLSESSLASRFNRTTAPRNQISCASILAAINNRSETDNVEFNTLESELLTREVQEVSSVQSRPFN
jgi:hypothetical protein